MAVLLICHHCGTEYACSENFPDPCQKCGTWDLRFKNSMYLDTIVMNTERLNRQVIKVNQKIRTALPESGLATDNHSDLQERIIP